MNVRTPAVVAAFVGATVTLIVSFSPLLSYAYSEPALDVATDSASAMIALLVAFLLVGRVRQRGYLADVILIYAMLLFALANLGLSAVPRIVWEQAPDVFMAWGMLFLRFFAALAFAVAPFLPRRRVGGGRRRVALRVAVALAATFALWVGVLSVLQPLPEMLDSRLSPTASSRPQIVGHPAMLAVQLLSVAVYALGTVGYLRAAKRRHDELFIWCAAGGALSVFAGLNFFLFPSAYSEWFYVRDLLWFGFHLLLLVGALREIQTYWTRVADAAVVDERRRIARDLHDGLAQELAFIAAQAGDMAETERRRDLAVLAAAAQRALDESRRAITLLSKRDDEPLDRVLGRTAETIGARFGAEIEVDVPHDVAVDGDGREALIRILREAVTNAGRHGGASRISVSVADRNGQLLLEVADDGTGFDASAAPTPDVGSGFGLLSMRERAEQAGGGFAIRSEPGAGTEVAAWIPSSR